jgi:hypothetical protein
MNEVEVVLFAKEARAKTIANQGPRFKTKTLKRS